jgi:toxin HigB-1
MIKSFRNRETEKLFNTGRSPKFQSVEKVAARKLEMLNAATSLGDLAILPGNQLEQLTGDRAGQHSIRINRQWRLCFKWSDGDAEDVEIVDYH